MEFEKGLKMGLRNSELSYGAIAKFIHWTTALCILVAYASIEYMYYFTEARSPEYISALRLHMMFGMTVLLLFLPRLIWKLINPNPRLDPAPRWQHLAAKSVHWALYGILILAPITGWLGTGGRSVNMFGLFELPTFRGTDLFSWLIEDKLGMTFQEWEGPVDFIHKQILGKWVVWILIAAHVGAALYHHYVQKDNTLRRMLPFGRL